MSAQIITALRSRAAELAAESQEILSAAGARAVSAVEARQQATLKLTLADEFTRLADYAEGFSVRPATYAEGFSVPAATPADQRDNQQGGHQNPDQR